MATFWHLLMGYVWAVLALVGVIIAGILWVGMAAWENVRKVFGHPEERRHLPPGAKTEHR